MAESCLVCQEQSLKKGKFEYVQFIGTRALDGSTCGIMLPVCLKCLNTKFVRNRERDYVRAGELGA